MTDEARSTKESGTQKAGWRETGGLKVLGRKRDKDGKEGSSEGRDKHMKTDRKRLFFECQCSHTLSTGRRAARWLLTQHTQTYKYTHIKLHVAKKTCWAPAET